MCRLEVTLPRNRPHMYRFLCRNPASAGAFPPMMVPKSTAAPARAPTARMFNPHDLVPLAQAIGACHSATQLRRPSIKLPLKTSPNETCAVQFVGPGMPEEECAGQRHARILTVAVFLQRTPRQSRGGWLLPSRPWTGFRQDKSRRKLLAWWSMSSSGCTSWRQSRSARAPSKLCRMKKRHTTLR